MIRLSAMVKKYRDKLYTKQVWGIFIKGIRLERIEVSKKPEKQEARQTSVVTEQIAFMFV